MFVAFKLFVHFMFLFNRVAGSIAIKVKCSIQSVNVRKYCKSSTQIMKYLNVAEKNDAAKSISSLLSNGTARRTEGLSPYNKLYSFQINFRGTNTDMVMTSVSGHLMTHEFTDMYKYWQSVDPITLFDAPVLKICPDNFVKIKQTLEREVNFNIS